MKYARCAGAMKYARCAGGGMTNVVRCGREAGSITVNAVSKARSVDQLFLPSCP
jgi:hypothetical protein